jgi:hypothetical protein
LSICDKIVQKVLENKKGVSRDLIKGLHFERIINSEERFYKTVLKESIPPLLEEFESFLSSLNSNDKSSNFLFKQAVLICFAQPRIKEVLEIKLINY